VAAARNVTLDQLLPLSLQINGVSELRPYQFC